MSRAAASPGAAVASADSDSDYRELPPPSALADYLICSWTQTIGADQAQRRPLIVPDGCIDVVWIGDATPRIVGPMTAPILAMLPPGAGVAGVRFRPGMANGLLGIPANELLDLSIPLRDAWGPTATSRALDDDERCSVETKLAALERTFVARLAVAGPGDYLVAAGARWLLRHPTAPVHRLGAALGMSERQLLRRFTDAVGYGPKTLQRILRFQRLIQLVRAAPAGRLELASLAHATGYADQAHMTREVTRLAGVPPSRLPAALGRRAVSDSFKTAAERMCDDRG